MTRFAALVQRSAAGAAAVDAAADATAADAPAPSEPTEAAPADAASDPEEPGVDAVPVLPLAASVTDGEPAARPRRSRRSLAFRFGISFVVGFLVAVGIGAAGLYAWGQQYEGRVLPGVHIGNTDLGGLTREQAKAQIASAYGSLGQWADHAHRPGRPDDHPPSFADVGRGPDTSALVDDAMAAGRQGDPIANLIGAPQAAAHGVTLDSAVTYDHDKLAAAVGALATTIDQTPVDASATAGQDGTFHFSPAKDGRAVDQAALLTALDQQLAALGTPASIDMAVPVEPLAPAVATSSAEAAKTAADRMAADVVIARGKETWTIPGTSLAPLISFTTAADGSVTPLFDEAGLDPMLKTLTKKVNQTVRNASLRMINGHIVATGTSREGRTLDAVGMKAAIVSEIGARQAGAIAAPVEAVVKGVDPEADHGGRQGVRPQDEDDQLIQRLLLRHRQQPLGRQHRGARDESTGRSCRRARSSTTGRSSGTCTSSRARARATRSRAERSPSRAHSVAGSAPRRRRCSTPRSGPAWCRSPDRTTTSSSPGIRRVSMPPCGRRQSQADHELQERHEVPNSDHAVRPTRRQHSMAHLKIWSVPNGRTAKVSNVVIQHGPRAINTIVHDSSKPVGYSYVNNSPADGAKVWVTVSIYDHGESPLAEALPLELPGGRRRHRRGNQVRANAGLGTRARRRPSRKEGAR